MASTRLFIHATNVHHGGGRVLLDALLKAIPEKQEVVLSLDERMPIPRGIKNTIEVRRSRPTIVQRLLAEKWLVGSVKESDTVLCFGNLPPLFRLRARCLVFVQNRYLVDDADLRGFPFQVRWRLVIERLWLSRRMINADELIVQTPTMKRLLERMSGGKIIVRMLPFMAEPEGAVRRVVRVPVEKDREHDFIYVATGEPHKNHLRLFAAWRLLAEEGLFPSLCVTLDLRRFSLLCDELETMKQRYAIKVKNVGELMQQDVPRFYRNAVAAIYPSTFESFGLPLIEARQAGLPVLAAERDYVRDILDPEQTFDPESPVSIARAVKRFMGVEESTLSLLDAEAFLASIGDY